MKPSIDAEEVTRDVFGEDPTTALLESGRRKLVVLSAARDGRLMVVGAVILEAGEVPLNSPPPEIANAIAESLYDEGDVEIA